MVQTSNVVEMHPGVARAAKSAEDTLVVHLEPEQLEDYRLDQEDKYLIESVLQLIRYIVRGLASEYVSAAIESLISSIQRHREIGSLPATPTEEKTMEAAVQLLEHLATAKKALERRQWVAKQVVPKRLLLQDQQETLQEELRDTKRLLRESPTGSAKRQRELEQKERIEGAIKRIEATLVSLDELRDRNQAGFSKLKEYITAAEHAIKGPDVALLEEVFDVESIST